MLNWAGHCARHWNECMRHAPVFGPELNFMNNDLADDRPERYFLEARPCYNRADLHLANTKPTPSEVGLHLLVVLTKNCWLLFVCTGHMTNPSTDQVVNFGGCQSRHGEVTNSGKNWRRYRLDSDQLGLFNFLKLMFVHPANLIKALLLGWPDFAC